MKTGWLRHLLSLILVLFALLVLGSRVGVPERCCRPVGRCK